MGSTLSSEVISPSHEHYRTMARKNAVLRQDYSQQSQTAYKSGNGAKAKETMLHTNHVTLELSLVAKAYEREMYRYNNIARDLVFKEYNSHLPPNKIDLHGLKVQEALDITRERLIKFIKNKETDLVIIVGRGKNSVNGIAKIKPAVIELVREFHIKATPNMPNQGCIFVEPLPASQGPDFSWIDGFFRGILQIFSSIFWRSS
ncbi:hypothetical protein BGZ46_007403 [Entomortierella lignicola]|nr:hypothetical protein BGZ46_007403 [Entomortierella lignicola]